MARLGIDKDFLRDYARLEPPVRAKVDQVFGKFEHATHTGIHLEKITGARDDRIRTIKIDSFWRGVVLAPPNGDDYTLLKVLPHDDATAWATRRRASANAATGRVEIADIGAIEASLPELSRSAEHASRRLFEDVNDADLRRLGVDERTLEFARALTEQVQLDAAQAFLPANQWDALCGLAAGMSPEDVWAELGATATDEPYDPDDVAAAVRRSPDRVVLVDGPEELLDILRHPFALWRVYLHPAQQRVVDASYGGPARVTGGPGTGKTVVAMHRAHRLAGLGAGQVLLTTFTSTLSASTRAGLRLLTDSPDVLDRVTIDHVDRFAHQVFQELHGKPTVLSGKDEQEIWRRLIGKLDLPFTETFLTEEWRQVVLAQDVRDADGYLAAKRSGRGRRLGSRQRAQLWQGVCEFHDELRRRNVWTFETICVEATRILESRETRTYRHVVVDEAQDLSPMQWRLLRAAVTPAPDDLFVAGDTHQRIYRHRVSLRELGIPVTGRSTRLRVNYRTTAEILAWSLGVLRGEKIDNMDGGLESIAGYRSQLHGSPPDLAGYPTRNDELRAVAARVGEWISDGVTPSEIGIAARSNMLVDSALKMFEEASVPAGSLTKLQDGDDLVSVGTMHRMKGLEFRCLAAIGVGEHQVPPRNAVTPREEDELTHQQDLQRERCLLFVACTRARERLSVTWHGPASHFLTAAA